MTVVPLVGLAATTFAELVATPLGGLLVALVVLFVLALVGRVVLGLAWRLLLVAILVVAVLYLFRVLF